MGRRKPCQFVIWLLSSLVFWSLFHWFLRSELTQTTTIPPQFALEPTTPPQPAALEPTNEFTRHFCSDFPTQFGAETVGVTTKSQYCKLQNFCVNISAEPVEAVYFSNPGHHGGLVQTSQDSARGFWAEDARASWHSSGLKMSVWAQDIIPIRVKMSEGPVPEGVYWEDRLALVAKTASWGNDMDCLVNGLLPYFHLLSLFGLEDQPFIMAYTENYCTPRPKDISIQSVCWEMFNLFTQGHLICPWHWNAKPELLCFRNAVSGLGYLGTRYEDTVARSDQERNDILRNRAIIANQSLSLGHMSASFLPFRNFMAANAGYTESFAVEASEPIRMIWLDRRTTRRIANREEIQRSVKKEMGIDFQFYEVEKLTFVERFSLLSESNVCVSTWGSHAAFSILMRQGSVHVLTAFNGAYYEEASMRTTLRFRSHVSLVVIPMWAFKHSKVIDEPKNSEYPSSRAFWFGEYRNKEFHKKGKNRNIVLSFVDIKPGLTEAFDRIRSGF